jgi:hypothetical protein
MSSGYTQVPRNVFGDSPPPMRKLFEETIPSHAHQGCTQVLDASVLRHFGSITIAFLYLSPKCLLSRCGDSQSSWCLSRRGFLWDDLCVPCLGHLEWK